MPLICQLDCCKRHQFRFRRVGQIDFIFNEYIPDKKTCQFALSSGRVQGDKSNYPSLFLLCSTVLRLCRIYASSAFSTKSTLCDITSPCFYFRDLCVCCMQVAGTGHILKVSKQNNKYSLFIIFLELFFFFLIFLSIDVAKENGMVAECNIQFDAGGSNLK